MELQSWLDLVKKKFVDQERIMRARWVLAWKSSGKAKARLCVLGFQDSDRTEVPGDSPTSSTASEALIMQWVASHKYRLISGDIKTAFLSGDEDVRNIFIAPPDDVRQMLNVGHETVLRLRKAVCGMVNAQRNGGTGSKSRSYNTVSRVVLSTHACLFLERVEKFMECSVCMSTT